MFTHYLERMTMVWAGVVTLLWLARFDALGIGLLVGGLLCAAHLLAGRVRVPAPISDMCNRLGAGSVWQLTLQGVLLVLVALCLIWYAHDTAAPFVLGFFMRTTPPLIMAALVTYVMTAFGMWVQQVTNYRAVSQIERNVLAFGLGLGGFMLACTSLGFVGLLYGWTCGLVLLAMALASLQHMRVLYRSLANIRVSSRHGVTLMSAALYGLIALLWTFAFVHAVIPEPFHMDTTRSSMYVADVFAREHAVVAFPYDVVSHMPHYVDMFFAATIAVGDLNIASLMSILVACGSFAVLHLLYRACGGSREGPHVILLSYFAMGSVVAFMYGLVKSDPFFLFFTLLAAYYCVRYVQSRSYGHLVVLSLASGIMIGIKYPGFVYLPAVLLTVGAASWHTRDRWRRILLSVSIIFLLYLPWAYYNVTTIGNPLAPAFLDILQSEQHFFAQFGDKALGYISDMQRADTWLHFNYTEHPGILGIFLLPIIITYGLGGTAFSFMMHIGPLFLALLPTLFSRTLYRDPGIRTIILFVASSLLFFIPILHAVEWYILPTFCLLLVVYEIRAQAVSTRLYQGITVIVLCMALMLMHVLTPNGFGGSVVAQHYGYVCAAGTCTQDATQGATANAEIHTVVAYLEVHMREDDLVLDLNSRSINYFVPFARTHVISNHFGELIGFLALEGQSDQQILDRLRQVHVRYLLLDTQRQHAAEQALPHTMSRSDQGAAMQLQLQRIRTITSTLPAVVTTDRFTLYEISNQT